MVSLDVQKEKWLRIATSIAALYLASSLHGAVVPLVSEWEWAATNVTLEKSSASLDENPVDARTSFAVSSVFISTGLVELMLSPLTGMAADRYGIDAVVLFGILIATIKCLLYGIINTDVLMVLTNRILQGVISACMQGMAFARIRDVYDQATSEYMNVMAVALCKMASSLLIGFITGELYHIANHYVFFIFLPIILLLAIGVGMTFRPENFHSKSESKETCKNLQWRVVCDVQLIIVSLCFLVANLSQSALEPSVAVWMKFAFQTGPETTGVILGLCGAATIVASLVSAQILPILQDRSWIFCMTSLCVAGVPLVLVNFSPNIFLASAALCTHFIGATASRFTLLVMCSTIANERYPQAFGMVFSVLNMGWAASDILGPLLSSYFLGSVCVSCVVGATCIFFSFLPYCLRHLDAKNSLNFIDLFKSDRSEYELVIDQSKVPFTYDISEETLPKDENS